jgi:hypothetical protein
MSNKSILSNTLKIVENYLSESLKKFFNIEGKVSA